MGLKHTTLNKLADIVGKAHFSSLKEDLFCYGYDATGNHFMPDAVIFPANTEEISKILILALKDQFPVVARGAGTSMVGAPLPIYGGVVIVLTRLNHIIDIDADNFTVTVEPGVITADLQRELEERGLFYPPDPSSSEISTIGGNLAQCAGGPRAVKYGVTRDYVLGLEAVLPTGEVIHTGVKTKKGVVGYDLTRLIVGSEGTLAVITKITLRLIPLPETVKTMTAVFASMEHAAQAVSAIIKSGIVPRTLEFMDRASIQCVEKHAPCGFPESTDAALIIEVDGGVEEAEKAAYGIKQLLLSFDAIRIEIAQTENEVKAIWKARKAISSSLYHYGPDKINEDIVVPRSKIPEMVSQIDRIRQQSGLMIVSFGHAGDGNIHVNIMLDKSDKKRHATAMAAVDEIFNIALSLGGTLSGEHGIGITKKTYISKEVGSVEIALMKKIKKVFDPGNILNPGKLF